MTAFAPITLPRPSFDQMFLVPRGRPCEGGWTIVQAAAVVAGEPRTEHPESVSPVLAAWMSAWADSLDDASRQQLRRYIPALARSRSLGRSELARQWMVLDWLARVVPAIWLRMAGLADMADALRCAPPAIHHEDLVSLWETLDEAAPYIGAACDRAWRAVAAARDEARPPHRCAVWCALADAGWSAGHIGARHLLATGVAAARLDAGDALFRTRLPVSRRRQATHSWLVSSRDRWTSTWDTIVDAACVVAWTAIARATPQHSPIWGARPEAAWAYAERLATHALSIAHHQLDHSAVLLVDHMLSIGCGGQH
jgi:hypothetical protein